MIIVDKATTHAVRQTCGAESLAELARLAKTQQI